MHDTRKPRTKERPQEKGQGDEARTPAATQDGVRDGETAAGFSISVPSYFDDFPPSFPDGARVITWRIRQKNNRPHWACAVYIDNVKHATCRHENPAVAFFGAVRNFTKDVMPKLPEHQQEHYALGLSKIAADKAAAAKRESSKCFG